LLQYEEEDIKGELERCEPLVLTPMAVDGGDMHHPRVSHRWVVERVKSFYQVVGLSCEGYEDKLLALFEEIEAARDLSMVESKIGWLGPLIMRRRGYNLLRGRDRGRCSSRFL
jgi:hypothetical protein